MLTAKAFEVFQHCPPAGSRIVVVERDGMVKIADNGWAAASGESAGEIAATDGALECRRWLVAQGFHRTCQRIRDEYGCSFSQSANLLGVDDSVAL